MIIASSLNADPKKEGAWPIEERRYYIKVSDLKDDFEKHHVPIQLHEGKIGNLQYVIVAAFPYSGINSIDVYCYIYTGVNWRLYTLAFLTDSKAQKLDVVQDQNAIKIVHNDIVVLTLTF